MNKGLAILACAFGLAACAPPDAPVAGEPVPAVPAEIAALAHIYTFNVAESPHEDCLLKLDADDVDAGEGVVRLAWIDPRCYEAFPVLQALNQWAPIGSSGIRLIDNESGAIMDLLVVSDISGEYWSGAAADGKTYELRTPSW